MLEQLFSRVCIEVDCTSFVNWNINTVGSNPTLGSTIYQSFEPATTSYKIRGHMFNIECKNCKQLFESSNKNRKFCSQTCSAVHNNTGRIKRKLKYCLACSKLLEHNKKIYCSNKCQQNFAKNARTKVKVGK